MMAFSATYPEYLAKHLTRYMREPTFVRLNATDPSLQGNYISYDKYTPLPAWPNGLYVVLGIKGPKLEHRPES